MRAKCKILIVDDEPLNAKLLSATLSDEPYDIHLAANGEICLKKIMHESFDLILLDIIMPGMNGWEVCRRIKQNPAIKNIPVLFITSLGDIEHKSKGFDAGAVDYLIRPCNEIEIKARVKNHLALKASRDEIQRQKINLDEKVKKRTAELEKLNQALQREIVARRKAYAKLRHSEKKIGTY